MSVKAILTGQTNTASSTEESSVAVYNVTLTTANWTENEDGYIQRVPIISVTTDDTCVVIATPADGDKAWQYGIKVSEQATSQVGFSATELPEEDIGYKITVINPSRASVDALAVHNVDPHAHRNIELEVSE